MLRDHVRSILDGVTGLLVGTRLLENVSCQHIADIVGAMR